MNAPAIARRRAPARPGLHGHRLEGNVVRAAVAEATGTFVLVLTIVSPGRDLPGPCVGVGRVLGAEAVVTFLLVLVIIAVAADDRVPKVAAGMAIGAALGAAILIAGPVSGAGVNPVRAIGPMVLAGKFTDWWAYLVAPVVASSLAVLVYDQVLRRGSAPG